jgi:hypothetical protein
MVISTLSISLAVGPVQAESDMPDKYAAALIYEVAAYEANLTEAGKELYIYVFDNPTIESYLKAVQGKKLGKATIKQVSGGTSLPSTRPDIVVIGNSEPEEMVDNFINYARSIKALSITPSIDVMKKGVIIGLSVGADKKAKIMLNIKHSSASNLRWNPAIMKQAQIVK